MVVIVSVTIVVGSDAGAEGITQHTNRHTIHTHTHTHTERVRVRERERERERERARLTYLAGEVDSAVEILKQYTRQKSSIPSFLSTHSLTHPPTDRPDNG